MDRTSLGLCVLFVAIVLGYCFYYAPFGLNETDGGFLSGLAWQVLQGKALYQDVLYVRPPLPVWLRAFEMKWLPETMAILGERWIFYAKIALYSYLGASILSSGKRKWVLAILGFVVSAHCYPAMAWHTVDGILFAVIAASLLYRAPAAAGFVLVCAMLCKQSFYPLPVFFGLFLWLEGRNSAKKTIWFSAGFGLGLTLFLAYLSTNHLLAGFLDMTNGSASGGQAFQHGLADYFRITPELAIPGFLLLIALLWFRKAGKPALALGAWLFLLTAIILSYAGITWLRQDHTVPFAQSRFMFWMAGLWLIEPVWRIKSVKTLDKNLLLLLGISWCASVSWGYNLPILFAAPWVWAAMEITRELRENSTVLQKRRPYWIFFLLSLLFSFRIGYEFVYRDGRRSDMREEMGAVFPQLSGIYTDRETAILYRELKELCNTWGPDFKTLPAFPQSNYLTKTRPQLPLDWVVNRETNGDNALIYKDIAKNKPVFFIEKSFEEKIKTDPQLELTRKIWTEGELLSETPNFWVVRAKNNGTDVYPDGGQ